MATNPMQKKIKNFVYIRNDSSTIAGINSSSFIIYED